MLINYNSQLGLRFSSPAVKLGFLRNRLSYYENKREEIGNHLEYLEELQKKHDSGEIIDSDKLNTEVFPDEYSLTKLKDEHETKKKIVDRVGTEIDILDDSGSSYFLICESVYKAAELIKIGINFTGRTIKDIKIGKYTYLMGKHEMVRFVCSVGAIHGFYYDDQLENAFWWGIEMTDGKYYFEERGSPEIFSRIMQILTFIELGDIEVTVLENGRNNGGKKNIDKIVNKSNNTVYVVDSSWNKLIIRTEGFAVRGHFRLQPCGEGMKDRNLVWINAFEKHGYKRKPKAEIIR